MRTIHAKLIITLMSLFLFVSSLTFAEGEATDEGGSATNYINLEPNFTVNYGGPGRLKYLKTDISLRVKREGMADVEIHNLAIRHIIVMLLSRQLDEDVSSSEGREFIRKSALTEIQNFMMEETGKKFVVDVLFNSFVVQK